MGKVPTATAMTEMKRKKKGRPSKNPLPLSTPPKPSVSNSTSRRSTRRNPNQFNSPPEAEFDDDDDERKEKKVKLVVRLPQSDDKSKVAENRQQQQSRRHSNNSDSDYESASGSGSDPEDEDREEPAKKRKINGAELGSDDGGLDQDKEVVEATETPLHGSPLESGPTTLPDKKLLVFILDRLQKKDTYGVFSEPVDPEELPDYFDIIKQPMDFGTVRKKLEKGSYKNLDELEADVNLICSNAMEYNASDTVYHRQARAIQELAKRDFKNLKHEGDDGEPQPKVLRRGRPPSNKNQKSSEAYQVVDRVGSELSPGAALASGEDKANGSNLYNLRKASALFRYRSTDPFVSSYGSRNGEHYPELSADWNEEFPASILRADMKYGKKQFTVDENKRDTYRESGNNLYNSVGNMKLLVPVGLQVQEALVYARSLARYAANLGPVAWKMASKKIETVIPAGVQYGRGWVGDNGPLSQPLPVPIEKQKQPNSTAGDCSSSKLTPSSTSDLNSAVRKSNGQNELPGQGDAPWRTPFPPQQNYPHRNGVNRMFGYDLSVVPAPPPPPPQKAETRPTNDPHEAGEKWAFVKSQQRHALSVPPDLNVRVLGGSPGPSLPLGSPQQPDLALQL